MSLKQVIEETVRFSSSQSIFLMVDGERSTRQVLRAVEHCRAQLGLRTGGEDDRRNIRAMDRQRGQYNQLEKLPSVFVDLLFFLPDAAKILGGASFSQLHKGDKQSRTDRP